MLWPTCWRRSSCTRPWCARSDARRSCTRRPAPSTASSRTAATRCPRTRSSTTRAACTARQSRRATAPRGAGKRGRTRPSALCPGSCLHTHTVPCARPAGRRVHRVLVLRRAQHFDDDAALLHGVRPLGPARHGRVQLCKRSGQRRDAAAVRGGSATRARARACACVHGPRPAAACLHCSSAEHYTGARVIPDHYRSARHA